MILTEEQKTKLELVDKLLGALDQDSLQYIIGSEQVVARLRGTETRPFVKDLFVEQERRIAQLESKLHQMDYAINVLLKYLSPDSMAETNFKTLKMNRSIY